MKRHYFSAGILVMAATAGSNVEQNTMDTTLVSFVVNSTRDTKICEPL